MHDRQVPSPERFQQGNGGLHRVLDSWSTELLGIDEAVDEIHHQQAATLTNACGAAKALTLVNLFGIHITVFVNQLWRALGQKQSPSQNP